MTVLDLTVGAERWKLKRPFSISREVITENELVVVQVTDGKFTGRGEGCPEMRFGETAHSVVEQILDLQGGDRKELDREELQGRLPPGAARNAVDCALWDLEAKQRNCSIWQIVGIARHSSINTSITIGVDSPEAMSDVAASYPNAQTLKVKLAGDGSDISRLEAIRRKSKRQVLYVDANEAWSIEDLFRYLPELQRLGVKAIEQPVPATDDEGLKSYVGPIPLVADESCTDAGSLVQLVEKYQIINIKLDKSGGLTEALKMLRCAERLRLGVMTGCTGGTSLSMAPSYIIGTKSMLVDLYSPPMLTADRPNGVRFHPDGTMEAFSPKLWG